MLRRGKANPPGEDGDEASLIDAAKQDPRAFAPLYERYFEPVHGYALRRLGDRERAADATSQVFLNALAALPRYRAGSFRCWLFSIAHNVVIDAARRTKPQTRLPDEWDPSDPGPSPEETAIVRDDQRLLFGLLNQLTPEQREVIDLRLAGLNGQEIADHLGRGLPAVKSMQWRALARLKRLVDHETGGDIARSAKEPDCVIHQ